MCSSDLVALLALCLLVGLIAWAWVFGLNVLAFASGALVTSSVQLSIVAAALGAYTLFAVAVGFLLGQLEIPENAINGLTNLLGMTLSFLGPYRMWKQVTAISFRHEKHLTHVAIRVHLQQTI